MARRVFGYVRRNHLGLIAIFIALGGTAYAANKVTSDDIAKNAVRSKHIDAKQVKPGDVSRKLRDGCPAGTRSLSDICVRTASSPTHFHAALGRCATLELRLPTLPEAALLASKHDLPGVGDQDMFWTSEMTGDSRGFGVNDGGAALDSDFASSYHVLCVIAPSEGG